MAGDTEIFEHHEIQDIIHSLPPYAGNLDPKAYIDWELTVNNEFDEHDLSEKQKIYIASNILTERALLEWKHICRHDKVPQSWQDFKFIFRDAFIPAYYVDLLFAKLEKLKQGSRTVRQYYHDFKICMMFGGLDECMEDTMSRFMKGLNSEIQTMLISKTYNNLSILFLLACKAETQILLSANTCKDDVSQNVENMSTLNSNEEQHMVEPAADLPLSQCDLLAVICDQEGLCNTSLISSPQLEIAISPVSLAVHNILQADENNST